MPHAAANLSRRGKKMRKGSTSSTKNTAPVAKRSAPAGSRAAYQASGVGSG